MSYRRLLTLFSFIIVLSLVLVACGGAEEEPTEVPTEEEEVAEPEEEAPPPEEEEEAPPPEEEEPAAPAGEGTFLERAFAGEFDGTSVNIMSVQVDEDEIIFLESLQPFMDETGIEIVHSATKEFETQIGVQVDGGNPPDIAMFPQPALLGKFVADGEILDVLEFIPLEDLQERYTQGALDSATFVGPDGEPVMGGVNFKGFHKDLVWYNKVAFDAAGYEVPTTWDEMTALADTIVADGDTPWCIGMESGVATGWVATDWMEAIMLRTAPPEDYDAWVAGDLPFTSDQVRNAAQIMSDIWLNPDYVLGGTDQIVTEFIGDSPAHMFEDPPTCWLHKQASWITGFFGEGLEAGVDFDFFYLPGIDPAYGEPVLAGGDIMSMFASNDRPEVRAVLEHLSTGASVETMVRNGRALSPHQDSSLDWYTTETDRRIAEQLLNAAISRFDASDLMPPEVGVGSFWTSMTDYVSGAVTLDEALQEIDDSWPR